MDENILEVWKDVVGYDGLYQVSNMGRVKNIETQQVLKHFICNGYPRVGLSKENKHKNFYVHRLMAQAFLKNPNSHPQINHKDEVKTNNYIDNIEWCSQKYNLNYGTARQRMVYARSKPIIQKNKQGEIIKAYPSASQAQRETGISDRNICGCLNGNRKLAGGFMWERDIVLEKIKEVQNGNN